MTRAGGSRRLADVLAGTSFRIGWQGGDLPGKARKLLRAGRRAGSSPGKIIGPERRGGRTANKTPLAGFLAI